MATVPRLWFAAYRVPVIAVLIALLVSLLLWPLTTRYPYIFFWPAVIFSIWAGGRKSGLIATLFSVIMTFSIFQTSRFQLRPDEIDLAATAVFTLLAAGMTALVTQIHERATHLSETEQRFRRMVDSVPGCVWTADTNGGIDFANRYWHEFTGLSPEQTHTMEWSAALHPADLERTIEAWTNAARTGQPYELAARNRRADGEWRWLLNRATPVFNADGTIKMWYGTSIDVTELKEAQEALRRERELLQTLIDTIPVMITLYHPDASILRLNPAFAKATGWTTEAAQGISLMEQVYPDSKYREQVSQYMASLEPGWRDIEMRARDGHIIESSWANIRLTDDTQVGIGIDITERKQAEERLRASERKNRMLRELMEALGSALTIEEVAKVAIDHVMNALEATTGSVHLYSETENSFSLVYERGSLLSPEQLERWKRYPARPELPGTHIIRTKQALWFESGAALAEAYPSVASAIGSSVGAMALLPLFAGDRPIGVQSVTFTTAHPFSEEEQALVLALAVTCAQAFERARLYEAEAKARTLAEAASQARMQFLAMISHELRTPLTSIKGFASTLLAEDVEWEAEAQHEFIQIMDQEADKLKDLIEQLLNLSSIQAGLMKIRLQPTTLSDVLAQARLDRLIKEHIFSVSIPDHLPSIIADPERIGQVLSNLIENAVKYSPHDTPISVTAHAHEGFVQIDVSDEGIGIPEAMREVVFEPFQQLAGAKKGVGLGLAICKGLIDAHGGRIWIDATKERGTTVSFTLPLAQLPAKV